MPLLQTNALQPCHPKRQHELGCLQATRPQELHTAEHHNLRRAMPTPQQSKPLQDVPDPHTFVHH